MAPVAGSVLLPWVMIVSTHWRKLHMYYSRSYFGIFVRNLYELLDKPIIWLPPNEWERLGPGALFCKLLAVLLTPLSRADKCWSEVLQMLFYALPRLHFTEEHSPPLIAHLWSLPVIWHCFWGLCFWWQFVGSWCVGCGFSPGDLLLLEFHLKFEFNFNTTALWSTPWSIRCLHTIDGQQYCLSHYNQGSWVQDYLISCSTYVPGLL